MQLMPKDPRNCKHVSAYALFASPRTSQQALLQRSQRNGALHRGRPGQACFHQCAEAHMNKAEGILPLVLRASCTHRLGKRMVH